MIVTGGTGPDATRHEQPVVAGEQVDFVRTTTELWSILLDDTADQLGTTESQPGRS